MQKCFIVLDESGSGYAVSQGQKYNLLLQKTNIASLISATDCLLVVHDSQLKKMHQVTTSSVVQRLLHEKKTQAAITLAQISGEGKEYLLLFNLR